MEPEDGGVGRVSTTQLYTTLIRLAPIPRSSEQLFQSEYYFSWETILVPALLGIYFPAATKGI